MNYIDFGVLDIIDIILVAILIYQGYIFLKRKVTLNIFIGALIVIVVWKLVGMLDLVLLNEILDKIVSVGVLILVVVFQQEIRTFLLMIGTSKFTNIPFIMNRFFSDNMVLDLKIDLKAVMDACQLFSSTKTGALIVLERNNNLDDIIQTKIDMNVELNSAILESIFFKNSPLHDGAIIVRGNKIIAVRAVLPVSEKKHIPRNMGLRHRAAVGITEDTDSLVIIVSEESGEISYVTRGAIVRNESVKELFDKIKKEMA
ncbi:diadenylate cyclase [Ichthyobacterium seriolicida]|uniref:Diadenylate cyclase n=1 Tax=Ichthyobacterium seriolicida TaxID=242600 RepID=A0A1J1E9T3_9FLAO|nr:diadenylate cyclase [Ichthyobacterium seriolicida]BAV94288.1 hypothetical protein JBKA6_0275 [Ichthyobacterium seriolicida]